MSGPRPMTPAEYQRFVIEGQTAPGVTVHLVAGQGWRITRKPVATSFSLARRM